MNTHMKTKLKRVTKWIILNALIVWGTWEAVHGNVGAGRVLAIGAWIIGPLQFLVAFSKKARDAAKKQGRTVPAWMSHGVGMAVVGFLIYHGWVNVGIAWLMAEFGEMVIYSNDEEDEA